jgi:HlyD family secretion protein
MAKKKKNTKGLWIIIAALVIIVGLIIYAKTKPEKGIAVTTCTPEIATIVETIPANGKIKPVTEVKISPDVSGEIIELNFEEGDYVKKGELVIKINQDVYISARERAMASLNSIKAQYLQQKAQLRQTELTYNRNKILYEQKAIADSEYEESLSQYEVAKEQLKAAEYNIESASASLKEAEENLTKTVIYAPMDGIISKRMVEKGERVVGTSQMAGTEMLRIADFDKMEVLVDVNENDIIRIQERDTAIIDVDAYPSRKFKGVVTQIANSAKNIGSTSSDQVTNFEVKVLILKESYQDLISDENIPFRPGMSASVQIETLKKENIMTLPLQCITTRQELGDSTSKANNMNEFVFAVSDDNTSVKVIPVKTGIQDITKIEIISELDKDTKIITGPYTAISKSLTKDAKITID